MDTVLYELQHHREAIENRLTVVNGGDQMPGVFKVLIQKIKKDYKKGQWNRFIISFLILAQLGLLAIADGSASLLEDPRTPIIAEKITLTGTGGVAGTTEYTAHVAAAGASAARASATEVLIKETAIFRDMLQVSETSFDRAIIYAWVQISLPADQYESESWSNDFMELRLKILELNPTEFESWPDLRRDKVTSQNEKTKSGLPTEKQAAESYLTDAHLIETKQGELIKISTRRIGTANTDPNDTVSFYFLIEVSQITSVDRAVVLRQLVTHALEASITEIVTDDMESGSMMTNVTDTEGIVSDRVEPNNTGINGIGPDGTEPNSRDGIESNDIKTVPVKSSLNLTLSRSGHLSQAEQLELVKRMLAAAGAGNTQGINTSELISLTAYTPRLAGYENLAGEPVNLQIASRYHSLDNRTYFQIGAPLLMIEY